MIIDCISKQIGECNTIKRKQQIISNASLQKALDDKYSKLVEHIESIVLAIEYTNKEFGFKLIQQNIDKFNQIFNSSKNCFYDGFVDSDKLSLIEKNIKDLEKSIKLDWQNFYLSKINGIIGTLRAIKDINRLEIEKCLELIISGKEWSLEITRLKKVKQGIEKAQQIISELSLNDHIIDFLKKISLQTATVTDLTQEVLDWIYKENLEKKVYLRM